MNDLIDTLRSHDPERHGSPEPPPVEGLLALIDAEEARAARAPAAAASRLSAVRPPRWVGRPRGGPVGDVGLTLPARAVRSAFVLGLAAAVLAVTLLVALGGGPAGGPPSLAPGAPASLAPIVHVRSRSYVEYRGRRRVTVWKHQGRAIGTLDGTVDRWSTAAPLRWRQIKELPPVPGSDMPGGTREEAYADGLRLRRSSFGGGRIWRRALRPELWKRDRASAMGDLQKGTPDPRAAIEQLVANGFVEAAGEEVRDGRRLRRFVRLIRDSEVGGEVLGRTTFLLDFESWVPVEIVNEARSGSRMVSVYDVYETLPATEENLRLLEFGGPTG